MPTDVGRGVRINGQQTSDNGRPEKMFAIGGRGGRIKQEVLKTVFIFSHKTKQ